MQVSIKQISILFISLLPITSWALNFKERIIPIQVGVFSSSQGKAQDINILTLIGNRYTVNNNNNTNAFFGAGYFIKGLDKDLFQLNYGVNGFYFGTTSVDGVILQEHIFDNLSYRYNIRHIPVYLAAKANIKNNNEKFNLILDVGIGPNFMKTSNYRETPLCPYTIPDNAFSGNTSTEFSATAGIGVRLNNIIGKVPVECGYKFFYFGEGQLNARNNQILNNLNTGTIYANAFMCSVIA